YHPEITAYVDLSMLEINTNVDELSICLDCDISFSNFKIIIQKFTRLTKLSVKMTGYRTISDDRDFLNGFQWEQLISTYLPNLYELKFRIVPWKTRLNNQLIDSFKTGFWIQH
ncbi:unnamed protein product, partial [Rotaria sp. Silwood2]